MKWLLRNFEALISSAGFVVMLGIVIINVFLRYFAQLSLPFSEEISYLGFAYTVFFGASMLYRHHGLIAVTVLVDRLPFQVRHWVLVFNFALLASASAYFCYLGYYLSQGSWVRRTPFLEIPYFWINIAPTIAFGLMALYSLRFLFIAVRGGPAGTKLVEDLAEDAALTGGVYRD